MGRLFLLLILTVTAFAGDKFTIQDKLSMIIPNSVVISPNGDKVLFTIRKADFTESKWNTQVFILDVKTGVYSQFTQNGTSCTTPQFSPDQKWVTFLSSREGLNKESNKLEKGTTQLWATPLSGGESDNWTSLPNGVDEYVWSKDGSKIAILSDRYDEDEEDAKSKKLKVKRDEIVFPKTNPIKTLHVFDVNKKIIISSFDLDAGVSNIMFNSNGDKIIYQTNITGEYNDDQKQDIYEIDLTGKIRQITSDEGPETLPVFSINDKFIAYKTQTVPDIEFAESDLTIMNYLNGSKVNLTSEFDYSVNSFLWKNAETILFTVNEKTDIHLYEININSKAISKVSKGNGSISNLSLSEKGHLSYKEEDSKTYGEIAVNGKRVSSFSEQLKSLPKYSQEVISYKSKDGKFDLEGIIFKPENFNPKNKYPLISILHGGPYGNFRNTLNQSYAVELMTQEGYLVFAPNPRGSSGYSDKFGQANRYDLGGGDYEDIMSGIDFLIAEGCVDSNRMGVTGGSYGGYLTNWIISQNNRFKAAVSLFGIYSFLTDWSNSWQPEFEKMFFGYYYWEKPIDMNNLYINRSPSFYTHNIKTPTLILQGEKDQYTDISNSREMYQALKQIGTPVQFVVYPREGHGIRNEPNHYCDSVERAIDWFNKYLLSK
jgi:dipeptidyl aminopeptidase/acylaminoacyl peptidase